MQGFVASLSGALSSTSAAAGRQRLQRGDRNVEVMGGDPEQCPQSVRELFHWVAATPQGRVLNHRIEIKNGWVGGKKGERGGREGGHLQRDHSKV